MIFSKRIENTDYSPIRKFYPYQLEAQKQGKKIYHLNIGQPDIKTPDGFFNAVKNYSQEVLEYSPSPGLPALINAVRGYYNRLGVEYGPNDVIITNGGSEALQFAFNCILDEGDDILIADPVYSNYLTFTTMAGANVVPIETSPENGYKYADMQLLEKAVTPRTKAILITNPGNPTGTVLTKEERRIIADFAIKHDLFIVADEVYREFIYTDEPMSTMAEMDDISERLIIIDSISKRFSACGARIGALISKNQQLTAHVMKLCQARLCVATIDQIGAIQLYNTDSKFFEDEKNEYMHRRDVLCRELSKIEGVSFTKPDGAFYLMVTLPVDDSEKFLIWLLSEFSDNGETLMYAPGSGFYKAAGKGKHEVRLAYVINEHDIIRSVELLGKALKIYNNN